MRKGLLLVGLLLFLIGCRKEEKKAPIPAYLSIPAIRMKTDLATEGTASQRITTAWVRLDGEYLGAFDLPAEFPVIAEGNHRVEVFPGINLNGQSAFRFENEFWVKYEEVINFEKEKVHYLNASQDSLPFTEYNPLANVVIIEDFDGTGLNLEATSKSDTSLLITTDSAEIFRDPSINEPNKASGKIVLSKDTTIFELATIQTYALPKGGRNVLVELHYKNDIQFTVGVFANLPGQVIQAPVVTVFPSEEWNKIYINLVSEVSGYPNATDFKIFIGGVTREGASQPKLYFDNIKLIYY
ncbi:MAG: hypothetical protein LPK80_03465 [Bacteroidota bacterium]|nr:hypothetical protein [Bacteroidota bacterium]MDX5428216.1 hypothetical protein [Bacteroidota bacterium]MDX5505998.1 hypothetical protein [Bacteroidota bacterium]